MGSYGRSTTFESARGGIKISVNYGKTSWAAGNGKLGHSVPLFVIKDAQITAESSLREKTGRRLFSAYYLVYLRENVIPYDKAEPRNQYGESCLLNQ